ncbi:MAG: KTSC domain-containing protein [Thermoguttaceae bacterium]|nr:KTSC domain-containing protein [Thermoguttaceae bacterium]
MRGWGALKNLFQRLWKAGIDAIRPNGGRVETPTDSPLSSDRTRTEADWGAVKRRIADAERIAREREEDWKRLEEQLREEDERRERRDRWGTAPTVSDGEGLRPQPSPGSYGGAVPRQQVKHDANYWLVSGEFQLINNSDNVYAIAYDVNKNCLYVQYKHWAPPMQFGAQNGPGPIYEYKNVSIAEARALYRAKDVGAWLWDNVRRRGTWSGHKKPYRLVAISRGYLPRKATYWIDGREWFIRRQMWGSDGRAVYSQLPNAPAPPMGYDGQPDRSDWKPYRGRPNNGRPNDGRPYRGR